MRWSKVKYFLKSPLRFLALTYRQRMLKLSPLVALMPFGIKPSLISSTAKPDLGCLGRTPSCGFTACRRSPKSLQVAAAAVHPWPWRSMGSDSSIPSPREGVKLPPSPFAPLAFEQSAKQADPGSLWHAVDLPEGNASSVPSAMESTESAAQAFRVQSPQQLQVHNCDLH